MKVITVKQPFAALIAEGLKEYEFRTWKTHYRGEILIHTGKGVDKEAMKRYEHLGLSYPSGVLLAQATITDCVYIDEKMMDQLAKKDPLVYYGILHQDSWNGYGFKLSNIRKVKPVSVNGKLGLWEYDGEISYLE